jgi:hypothetical protein
VVNRVSGSYEVKELLNQLHRWFRIASLPYPYITLPSSSLQLSPSYYSTFRPINTYYPNTQHSTMKLTILFLAVATVAFAAVPGPSPGVSVNNVTSLLDGPHTLDVCSDCRGWFNSCMGFWCKVFNPNCYADCQKRTCSDHQEVILQRSCGGTRT